MKASFPTQQEHKRLFENVNSERAFMRREEGHVANVWAVVVVIHQGMCYDASVLDALKESDSLRLWISQIHNVI